MYGCCKFELLILVSAHTVLYYFLFLTLQRVTPGKMLAIYVDSILATLTTILNGTMYMASS